MNSIFEINFDDEGIALEENLSAIFRLWSVLRGSGDARTRRKIRWTDVETVYAFKNDDFTVDTICMGFLSKNGESLELSERMGGWENLTENLPKYLPGCKNFHEVVYGRRFSRV